ncbi:exportin-7-A [Trichonephila inaurata madagascariensis]|uniref:Exportin-7-A n=1 Tax=Trichonephila inaurata madagascariensis TaxID=2747483 RepID=A0A8X6X9M0_9ARAC|nr:exportin-7-A [Trichonephila inaurata madagascariensis]
MNTFSRNASQVIKNIVLRMGRFFICSIVSCNYSDKLVSRNPQTLTLQQRIEIKNYVLSYLARCPKLASFVTLALVQLYSRLTKIGWFESYKKEHIFRNVIGQLSGFLQGPVDYCVIGIQILSQITCEINQINESDANKSLTKQRKTATSFRDTELYDIFQLACDLLRRAVENWKTPSFKDEAEHNLMSSLLRLAYNCISFDFIGTSPDESSDDLFTVQIPTSWRPAFLDFNSLQLFFDLYHSLTPSLSSMALLCLVQIASVRRTLFNNEERGKYLAQLVSGIKSILENPQKLSDTSNYHEFCRLLARLKTNYQLGELVRVESYPETIRLIAKFTVTSLQMWQFAPNSIHYLLSLWQRMVASVPYVKASEPHLLETYTPEVTQAFVTSRLEAAAVVIRDGLEDPLEDLGMVQQQLDQMSIIGRCEYEKTCALLVQLFDQTAQRYQELVNIVPSPQVDIAVQEGKCFNLFVFLIDKYVEK